MKYFTLLLLALLFVSFGCNETISTDQKSLEEYITENNLTVQEGPEGLRYVIEATGSPERPAATDSVTVHYIGRLTNNNIFDQSPEDPRTFKLQNLIRGWQIGIPLVGEGGKIKLLLPPSLGYGTRGQGSIPPNANLVFDIELVRFNE